MFLPVGVSKMIESLLRSGKRSAIKTSVMETRDKIIAVLIFGRLLYIIFFVFPL